MMRGFWSVYRKELYLVFASPIFFAVAFIFLVLNGYFFYSSVAYYNMVSFQAGQNPFMAQQLNVMDVVVRPLFMDLSIVLLLVAPLLTMRVYADERRTGTVELLFTLPVTDGAALVAKFLGVLSVLTLLLAGTLPSMALLGFLTDLNWKAVLSAYLGLWLLGAAFMALGVFTSSLTKNQIIAAVLSFGALLLFWVVSWMSSVLGPGASRFIEYLSIIRHFDSFSKGVLDSRDITYYLIFIAFFFFVTLRQIESYRWRG
ncbi:ABC-2 type transport system permease protein [Desulfacinum hydrothermale DSM 13146]|uniref:ABC-2 type transport system permease protein n=1 Tax=Desulfacinum hydrothermale DSM 13146 TaxID=1121390 RepID=A0A1W1XIP9_9BACT|nr:ABC transporter permease subunit [Desulfacinum hydrothermale]SMC23378.1 ABC-2 type transport system permease protein [Desulfacinum hydrothermale DSM 13146]